jgi:hypothetical protein
MLWTQKIQKIKNLITQFLTTNYGKIWKKKHTNITCPRKIFGLRWKTEPHLKLNGMSLSTCNRCSTMRTKKNLTYKLYINGFFNARLFQTRFNVKNKAWGIGGSTIGRDSFILWLCVLGKRMTLFCNKNRNSVSTLFSVQSTVQSSCFIFN